MHFKMVFLFQLHISHILSKIKMFDFSFLISFAAFVATEMLMVQYK